MADKISHLEEVPPPEAGGPTYQQMAEATDEAVFGMMSQLRAQHPGLGGAIVAGTAGGLSRYQLQGMPPGTSGQQVLEVLAPTIRNAATQIADALRRKAGLPKPKIPVVAPMKVAFDKLTAELGNAIFPTFCISTQDKLFLVTVELRPEGVLTHGSVVNLSAATTRPAEVLNAHCIQAHTAWTKPVPARDLHLRASEDGFRIYDGERRVEGPWGLNDINEALAALAAAKGPTDDQQTH